MNERMPGEPFSAWFKRSKTLFLLENIILPATKEVVSRMHEWRKIEKSLTEHR